ncbi:hypothetical protein O5175_08095 [Escherichia coli]|nr:hypothetical protein [Escherichia coli]MCZ5496741.1 hypothetical protein [Escherichia coli]MCZ5979017.1 hypothetical protein [Escherichia coli]MCZ6084773.1 hypothetical protein [Escherichia coli]MCZ6085175.1 hypothetical protein [Escherichia coli]
MYALKKITVTEDGRHVEEVHVLGICTAWSSIRVTLILQRRLSIAGTGIFRAFL